MARTKTKSGSKVIVTCPLCGAKKTKAGMVGHLRFKHGRDHKAPMLSITRPDLAAILNPEAAKQAAIAAFKDANMGDLHFLDAGDMCTDLLDCTHCRAKILAQLRSEGYTITEPVVKHTLNNIICTVRLKPSDSHSKA